MNDLQENVAVGVISRRFHQGLVEGFTRIAKIMREKTGLKRVCLSGGTFHNLYLSKHFEEQLLASGFEVFTHREVPAGDGGLSLGQALIAAAKLQI